VTASEGLPPRKPLARLPTPIERLPRLSERFGAELFVKRDDLTGFLTSGNKIRKLEYLLAEALGKGCDTLVTCGALQSNHARSTAVVARRLGLESVLVLRGEPPEAYPGNLLIDRMVGAGFQIIAPDKWSERDSIMEELAEGLRTDGRRPYVIPEGGSNALGACGYVHWVAEVEAQCHAEGLAFDSVVFRARIGSILEEAAGRFGWASGARIEELDLVDGYVGDGYGINRPGEWEVFLEIARTEGLLLDPVYTGKAFLGLMGELEGNPERLGRRVLFIHTGGQFALFAREPEIRGLLHE
jgi:D-cysteine desulfhydrase